MIARHYTACISQLCFALVIACHAITGWAQSKLTVNEVLPAQALARGMQYFGVPEQFNRYYTDVNWQPKHVLYVSPDGQATSRKSSSRQKPLYVQALYRQLQAGDKVVFLAGDYKDFNLRLSELHSGTYDDPIVFYGERDASGQLAVTLHCRSQGVTSNHSRSCFNLEHTDYVAIDGFIFAGIDNQFEASYYGVRAVGAGFAATAHAKGLAVLNSQLAFFYKDPIFTGQSDWAVIQNNVASHGGKGDGHGIYISNGSDFNIVRLNELHSNASSDFQVNADPLLTCKGLAFTDEECDGDAKAGLGRGASDYMLIEGNYFHHGLAQGPNLTSMRRSIFRHNVVAFYTDHNTSFWQETDNPQLGSHSNQLTGNVFIGQRRGSHVLQFIKHSDRNQLVANVFIGMDLMGHAVKGVPLVETDMPAEAQMWQDNVYIGGYVSDALEKTGQYQPDVPAHMVMKAPFHLQTRVTDFLPPAP